MGAGDSSSARVHLDISDCISYGDLWNANANEALRIKDTGTVEFKGGDQSTDALAVRSENGGASVLIANFRGVTDTGDTGRLGVGKNNNALIYMNASGSQVDTFAIGNTDNVPLVFSNLLVPLGRSDCPRHVFQATWKTK